MDFALTLYAYQSLFRVTVLTSPVSTATSVSEMPLDASSPRVLRVLFTNRSRIV